MADTTREELDRLENEYVDRWYLSEEGDTFTVKSADKLEMKRQMHVIIQSEITKAQEQLLDELERRSDGNSCTVRYSDGSVERMRIVPLSAIEAKRKELKEGVK